MFNKKLKAEIKELKYEIERLTEKNEKLKPLEVKNAKLDRENSKLSRSNNDIKDKLRKQTEADLFFTSAKICMDLLNGKKEIDMIGRLNYQRALQDQSQQAQTPSLYTGIAGQAAYYPYGRY